MGCLHADPRTCAVAEQLAEAGGNRRRYRFLLGQNVMKMLTGYSEKLGDLRPAAARRRDNDLAK
jgi:putative ribosome biogenesis GTPase RsgA